MFRCMYIITFRLLVGGRLAAEDHCWLANTMGYKICCQLVRCMHCITVVVFVSMVLNCDVCVYIYGIDVHISCLM